MVVNKKSLIRNKIEELNINQSAFSKKLIRWYHLNKRELPWRDSSDPYHIWLSEIILQQTRVDQGLPYYLKFTEQYPSIFDLANAPEVEVLRLWQGLGYYSRARNLHQCAKTVVEKYNGVFPADIKTLKSLKGIGDYTAAAIGSIAFKIPEPVIDGNVFRVIARYFDINEDISDSKTRGTFQNLLRKLIPAKNPDDFNQGLMEFGALHCTPKKPKCDDCIFSDECIANQLDLQSELPVKTKKVKIKNRSFQYIIFLYQQRIYMKQRTGKDIWEGLFDFHLIEGHKGSLEELFSEKQIESLVILDSSSEYRHVLTHQRINATFVVVEIQDFEPFSELLSEMEAFNENEILNLPKPKLIDNYLKEHFFSLDLI